MTRTLLNVRRALTVGAALALHGCGAERAPTEPVGGSGLRPEALASGGHSAPTDGRAVLVVDDDQADCARARFTTIQAALAEAQPGDAIRVCRGVYSEHVVVETPNLRIQALGAPGDVVLQ